VVEGSLLVFVYDVPYLPACGVFPPLHILNQHLAGGGAPGGMSPGATWEPFTISSAEYQELVAAIRKTPAVKLRSAARFADRQLLLDAEFDGIKDRFEWHQAVCAKHRAAFLRIKPKQRKGAR